MKRTLKTILAGIMAASLSLGSSLAAKRSGEIVFTNYTDPKVYNSKYLNLNGEASIDIAVLFDDEGKVDDWIPIRANDDLLVDSIERVIDQWEIDPMDDNGVAIWKYLEFNVNFTSSGTVVDLNLADSILAKFNLLKDDIHFVVPFSKLDNIPHPIDMDSPLVHSSLIETDSEGVLKFQFFIDENGEVRIPLLKESDTKLVVAGIVMETLMKWKFEPPTHKGKAVMTRAVIPFEIE